MERASPEVLDFVDGTPRTVASIVRQTVQGHAAGMVLMAADGSQMGCLCPPTTTSAMATFGWWRHS
ncbi:MAG: hypothetical protein BGO98_48290 [Myxococcales bacterium 68-20]|nr:MAG: hypothetical protein BGO98_48290 [Myxococcales bacterium 68-20]